MKSWIFEMADMLSMEACLPAAVQRQYFANLQRCHSGGQRIDRPAHFSHKGNGTGFPTDENMCTRTPGQSSRCTQGCDPHERPYRSMSRMCKKRSPILFTVPAFESVPPIFPGSPYASSDEREFTAGLTGCEHAAACRGPII